MSPNTDDPTMASATENLLTGEATTSLLTPPPDPTLVSAAAGTSRQHLNLAFRPAPHHAHVQSFQGSSSNAANAGPMTRSSTDTETETYHDTDTTRINANTNANASTLRPLLPRHGESEAPAQTPILTPGEVQTQKNNVYHSLVRNLESLQRKRQFYADTIENIRDRVQNEVEKSQRGNLQEKNEADEDIGVLVERVNYHREMFDRIVRQEGVAKRELERRRAEMTREDAE